MHFDERRPRTHGPVRLVWAAGTVATLALTGVAAATPYLPGDVAIARAVQALDLWPLGAVFAALNVLGSMVPSLMLAAVVASAFFAARRFDLLLLYLSANSLRLLVNVIKGLVDRPRPPATLVRVFDQPPESSFPSGHVVNSVLFYGSLAVLIEATGLPLLLRRVVQAACLAVVLLMGPARVYAGAHWPSDALGGYLWGTVMLAAVLLIGRRALRRLPRLQRDAAVVAPARQRPDRGARPPRQHPHRGR
jgi:membrane-associated phospholipid phosphatase